MEKRIRISLDIAKNIAVHSQLLDNKAKILKGKKGILEVLDQIGYIQIDTISVVQRAHHHTLWTRVPDYKPEHLIELQAKDKKVFEYWGHGASYLPISDFRYYLPRMKKFPESNTWEQLWMDKYKSIVQKVYRRIKKEGPLQAKDFLDEDMPVDSDIRDSQPAKVALQMLLWSGKLMIKERKNFARIYDLSENVLSKKVNHKLPTPDELGIFLVKRALKAHGIATENEIRNNLHSGTKTIIEKALHELIAQGKIIGVEVESQENNTYFALSELIKNLPSEHIKPSKVHILSPFDNLVSQRERIGRLFSFDFRIECYMPSAKRVFGYFSLPLLAGNTFIGRMDCKADRKTGILHVNNLVFEDNFKDFEKLSKPLNASIKSFASFNKCKRVKFDIVKPAKYKPALSREFK